MNAPALGTVLHQAEQLSYSDKALLIEKLNQTLDIDAPTAPRAARAAGIHAGKGWMAEDFDAPLPDEFWLGEGEA